MKNVLITGGSGFIGSNLCEFFLKKKFNIYVVDNLSIGKKNNIQNKKIKFHKLNINKIHKISKLVKIDIIIHLAARAEILIPKDREDLYASSNIFGLQNVLNFAQRKKVKKFIFASSASIYGDTKNKKVKESLVSRPEHFYAYSKLIGEQMVKNYCKINKINYTIFRFFNIYGKNSNAVVAKFIAQKLQNKKITIYGNGMQKRDFVHIKDLNEAIYKSIKNKNSKDKTYNLGSGFAVSVLDLKNIISNKKDHVFLEKRNDDIEISISDIKKITKDLRWKPKINFIDGVREMIKSDKKRLKRIKLLPIKIQQKLIKQFNNKINT